MSATPQRTVVHFSDSNAFGGTERAMLQLVARLNPERWRSVIFQTACPGSTQLAEEATALGVAVRPLRPVDNPAAGVASILPLVRAIRREGAAVFHAHQTWSLSCRYGIVAAALARVPAIVASAQLFIEMPDLAGINLQHALLTRCVDRHVAVSRHVASRLRERFGVADTRIAVIPNAVVISDPVPRSARLRAELAGGDGARPIVLAVARLDPQKGIEYLVRAAAEVPSAVFVIAGDGPDREELEALARSLRVDGRMRFLGHRRDVPELLAACDLFVLPSLYEGLPLSVLEAMAAGIPVIATAIGGTNEVVRDGETGTLVAAGDAGALALAIRGALADPARVHQLAVNAREYVVNEHSASAMAARMGGLYDELLSA
jgi:glycosyltransferase involved in cell wall biosynthesis